MRAKLKPSRFNEVDTFVRRAAKAYWNDYDEYVHTHPDEDNTSLKSYLSLIGFNTSVQFYPNDIVGPDTLYNFLQWLLDFNDGAV